MASTKDESEDAAKQVMRTEKALPNDEEPTRESISQGENEPETSQLPWVTVWMSKIHVFGRLGTRRHVVSGNRCWMVIPDDIVVPRDVSGIWRSG